MNGRRNARKDQTPAQITEELHVACHPVQECTYKHYICMHGIMYCALFEFVPIFVRCCCCNRCSCHAFVTIPIYLIVPKRNNIFFFGVFLVILFPLCSPVFPVFSSTIGPVYQSQSEWNATHHCLLFGIVWSIEVHKLFIFNFVLLLFSFCSRKPEIIPDWMSTQFVCVCLWTTQKKQRKETGQLEWLNSWRTFYERTSSYSVKSSEQILQIDEMKWYFWKMQIKAISWMIWCLFHICFIPVNLETPYPMNNIKEIQLNSRIHTLFQLGWFLSHRLHLFHILSL